MAANGKLPGRPAAAARWRAAAGPRREQRAIGQLGPISPPTFICRLPGWDHCDGA